MFSACDRASRLKNMIWRRMRVIHYEQVMDEPSAIAVIKKHIALINSTIA